MAKKKKAPKPKKQASRRRLPSILYPKMSERRYERLLIKFSTYFKKLVRERLIPQLEALEAEYISQYAIAKGDSAERLDGFREVLMRVINGIVIAVHGRIEQSEDDFRRLGREVNQHNAEQMTRAVGTVLQFDLIRNEGLEEMVELWVTENVDLIKGLYDDEAAEIRRIVTESFGEGLRHEKVAKAVRELWKPSDERRIRKVSGRSIQARSRLIARDQLGKLNGQISRQRSLNIGATRYIWRSSRDERVRASHKVFNGNIYYWDEKYGPTAPEGPPGYPINCRCHPEPVLDDLLEPEIDDF